MYNTVIFVQKTDNLQFVSMEQLQHKLIYCMKLHYNKLTINTHNTLSWTNILVK